ncbi:MAG: ribosomal protein L13e [Candidatus Bathyarchaeia archaeon]
MHHVKPQILKPDGRQRSGRGFSIEELKKAGVDVAEAKRMEVPVDKRRKTAHEQNVKLLKAYVEKKKAEVKPKAKPAVQSQSKKKAKS